LSEAIVIESQVIIGLLIWGFDLVGRHSAWVPLFFYLVYSKNPFT